MSNWFEPLESRQHLSATAHLAPSANQLAFEQVAGTLTAQQTLTLKNTGSARLTITSISLGGADSGEFIVKGITGRRVTLGRGASIKLTIAFMPYAVAVSGASLSVSSNDPLSPVTSIALRGLGAAGLYGELEPSLQRVFQTLQIPNNVGTSNPAVRNIDGLGPNDEVPLQLMQKAGPGPVTVMPLAMFGFNTNPVATIGWTTHTTSLTAHPLFSVPNGSGQSLTPLAYGAVQFDPGAATFGLFSNWPSESHAAFTEDVLNPWYTLGNGHAVRAYPYKTPGGQIVPHAYVVAFEQGADPDFQDAVLLVQNVMPAV